MDEAVISWQKILVATHLIKMTKNFLLIACTLPARLMNFKNVVSVQKATTTVVVANNWCVVYVVMKKNNVFGLGPLSFSTEI